VMPRDARSRAAVSSKRAAVYERPGRRINGDADGRAASPCERLTPVTAIRNHGVRARASRAVRPCALHGSQAGRAQARARFHARCRSVAKAMEMPMMLSASRGYVHQV